MADQARTTRKFEFSQGGEVKNSSKSCERSTILTVLLIVLVVALVVALVVVAVLLVLTKKDYKKLASAARIDSYINFSISPCDDFYMFACGGWLKKTSVPDHGFYNYGSMDVIEEQIDISLKSILDTEEKYTDSESLRQAKIFYKSCMNETMINDIKDADFKKELVNIFEVSSFNLKERSKGNFDLVKILSKLTEYGSIDLINLYVGMDTENSSKRVLQLEPIDLELHTSTTYDRLEGLIFNFAQLLDPESTIAQKFNMAKELVSFKKIYGSLRVLFQIHHVDDLKLNTTTEAHSRMTLEYFETNYNSKIDWLKFLQSVIKFVGLPNMSKNDIIIVRYPTIFKEITELLQHTDTRIVVNYLMLKFILKYSDKIGEKYNTYLMNEMKAMYGTTSLEVRYRKCARMVSSVIGLSFMDNFDSATNSSVLNITQEIKDSFIELLTAVDWMDLNMKPVLREKIQQMTTKIVFPVEQRYLKYQFDEKAFFNNTIAVEKETVKRRFQGLGMSEAGSTLQDEMFYPIDFRIWYNHLQNKINVPSGFLQPPYISSNYPKYLNYGSLGASIANAIMENFGLSGEYVNKQGSIVSIKENINQESYDKRAWCFTKEWNSSHVQDILERLSSGLKLAHKAYTRWQVKQPKQEQTLLTRNMFDQNQLFFLNYAQMMCMKFSDTFMYLKGSFWDNHVRLNWLVQNSPEFANAFNCYQSNMNQENMCAVW